MDKLELKHLAPYLPYGLKFLTVFDKQTPKLLTGICGNIIYYEDHEKWIAIDAIKPILRPLSDLEDNHCYVDQMEEDVNHSISYHNGLFSDLTADDFDIKWLPQVSFNWLVKNHFDVFDLIPAGLAISYKEAGL